MLKSFLDDQIFAYFTEFPVRYLYLHGWGRSHKDFIELLVDEDLGGSFAPDLPGFGLSPTLKNPSGSLGVAELLMNLFDNFDDDLVVVGHSFGARVAVRLGSLIHASERNINLKLVLMGAPLIALSSKPRVAKRYVLARKLARLGLIDEQRMEKIRQRFGSRDYGLANDAMRVLLNQVVTETYEGIYVNELEVFDPRKVHLIWGKNDSETPINIAKALVAQFGFPLVELDDDHLSILNRTQELKSEIINLR